MLKDPERFDSFHHLWAYLPLLSHSHTVSSVMMGSENPRASRHSKAFARRLDKDFISLPQFTLRKCPGGRTSVCRFNDFNGKLHFRHQLREEWVVCVELSAKHRRTSSHYLGPWKLMRTSCSVLGTCLELQQKVLPSVSSRSVE